MMKTFTHKKSSSHSIKRKPVAKKRAPSLQTRNFSPLSTSLPVVQRKANCACGGGCPRCQEKLGIQTKLRIGEPGDKYEQEADRVADQVMRMPEPSLQRQVEPEEEEEEDEEKDLVQTKREGGNARAVSPPLEAGIQSMNGSGRSLEPATRDFFEPRFGHDFSDVRVHTGDSAVQAAQGINAQAFTQDRDIFFGAGRYQPNTDGGRWLLAHELTHIIQQQGSIHNASLRPIQCHEGRPRKLSPAERLIKKFTERGLIFDYLKEDRLGRYLARLALKPPKTLKSPKNITLILKTFDVLSWSNRDDVAYAFIKDLKKADIERIAKQKKGLELLLRIRRELRGGWSTSAEKKEAERTYQATKNIEREITLKIVQYYGSIWRGQAPHEFCNEAKKVYRQCDIAVRCDYIRKKRSETLKELEGDTTLNLDSKSEVERAKRSAKALWPYQVPVALAEKVYRYHTYWDGQTYDGLCAVSNTAKKWHSVAHEVGHYYGLEHEGGLTRLMYRESSKVGAGTLLIKSECDTIKRKL